MENLIGAARLSGQASAAPPRQDAVLDLCEQNKQAIAELNNSVKYLQDLFVRRLNNDKQKAELIQTLQGAASFSFVEPFLNDLILLLDRVSGSRDEFVRSVEEELYEILQRRGVSRILVSRRFDPSLHRAVRVTDDPNVNELTVTGVVRNGYTYLNRVLRPADVIVSRPVKKYAEASI